MKLTPPEIAWLAQAFVDTTPLSLFANVKALPDGSEYQHLAAKGILQGQAYSPEALALLLALAKPSQCARLLVDSDFTVLEAYTYRSGQHWILVRHVQGNLVVSEPKDLADLIADLGELFGLARIRTTDLAVSLPPPEALLLLSLIDLYRQKSLQAYLQPAGQTVGQMADDGTDGGPEEADGGPEGADGGPEGADGHEMLTENEILAALAAPFAHGLVQVPLKNYGLSMPNPAGLADLLASLEQKGCIRRREQAAPGWQLRGDYARFARNFLIPNMVILNEVLQMAGSEILAEGSLYLAAGIHDILALSFSRDAITLQACSPLQMLMAIEARLDCPALTAASVPPALPAAPTRFVSEPPPVMAPAPAPAAGTWACPACGHLSTGNFCARCGSRRPV